MPSWQNLPVSRLVTLPVLQPPRYSPARLCLQRAPFIGGASCPREQGHPGECFWWLAWQLGGNPEGYWVAVVYRGASREAVSRGTFMEKPTMHDILAYLQLITRKRLEEKAKAEHARENPTPLVPEDRGERFPYTDGGVEVLRISDAPVTKAESAASRAARAMAAEALGHRRGAVQSS